MVARSHLIAASVLCDSGSEQPLVHHSSQRHLSARKYLPPRRHADHHHHYPPHSEHHGCTLFIMSVSCYKEKVSTLHHYKMKSMVMDLHIKFENIAQIAHVISPATFDIVLLCNEQNYTMMKLNVK